MRHDYYSYTKEELLAAAKLPVAVLKDSVAVFSALAQEMAEEIKRKNALNERTVFICPVGPVGQYPYFVRIVNRERIDLHDVWFINMDEYLSDEKTWIDPSDPLSFRGFMERNVYDKINPVLLMPAAQRIFPDPEDPQAADDLLDELGGADICFGGIGINGHLAFNEAQEDMSAEAFAELPTRILKITPETRTANAIGDLNGALEDMPKYCITIGMRQILRAKKVRLGCFRDWHRAVVRRAACGELTAAFPATLLQAHPDVLLRIPESVADLPR